jgi:predicted ribosome quality control (RQC) complex YloA/Tae2 family protein
VYFVIILHCHSSAFNYRFLSPDDVFVSSDVQGAANVIIKNAYDLSNPVDAPPGISHDMPVPPLTLQQAGTMSVVYSKAWESKIVTSAWVYVYYFFVLLHTKPTINSFL